MKRFGFIITTAVLFCFVGTTAASSNSFHSSSNAASSTVNI
jgi:hypothetical protein